MKTEEHGEIFQRFPKGITQFLKRYWGNIHEKARQMEKIWQGPNPSSILSYTCKQVHPSHIAACQSRSGTSKPCHMLRKNRHDLLNLHAVCPVFYKHLFYFAMSKNTKGCEGRISYRWHEVWSYYSVLWGNKLHSKKPHIPKITPSSITQILLFVTVLCVIAPALLPHYCFPFLAFSFLSLGTRCTGRTRLNTRQHFSYKQYYINNHRASVPVGRDSTKCWHIYPCS